MKCVLSILILNKKSGVVHDLLPNSPTRWTKWYTYQPYSYHEMNIEPILRAFPKSVVRGIEP